MMTQRCHNRLTFSEGSCLATAFYSFLESLTPLNNFDFFAFYICPIDRFLFIFLTSMIFPMKSASLHFGLKPWDLIRLTGGIKKASFHPLYFRALSLIRLSFSY